MSRSFIIFREFSNHYKTNRMKKSLPVLLLFLVLTACQSTNSTLDTSQKTLYSTLWIQTAAEYEALTHQTFNTSAGLLDVALSDDEWTAVPDQSVAGDNLPPAIILDVDETVLDNSFYEARGILDKTGFDPETWNSWVREKKAEAIKGAVQLTQKADSLGISVFYITNRDASVQESTEQNLRSHGFPVTQGAVMSNGGRPNWTSAKTERRQLVADAHRVLMLFGDDLNDFVPARGITIEERKELVGRHRNKWGVKWFIFPNPNYGSWERALYTGNEESEKERHKTRLNRLQDKRQ